MLIKIFILKERKDIFDLWKKQHFQTYLFNELINTIGKEFFYETPQ